MARPSKIETLLARLNPQQREAATHGDGPLLIVAGAGTGKTATLVHRVAWLIANGRDPGRILLLTFTRRAAAEMLRRADTLLRQLAASDKSLSEIKISRVWGGTFHAIATRLLRRYGKSIGLPPEFTVHDRTDSEDLMNVVRTELNLAKTDKRFPKKGTCMAIYSRSVNARQKLDKILTATFPWCKQWSEELKRLFQAYIDRKEAGGIMDYDDLLLYWQALLADQHTGEAIRKMFDCVLVDEYQDTNALQAEIIYLLSPKGKDLTVVGDDAQSIYAFRAATVRNILDFPKHYDKTTIITLEQNYRSTQPILKATNRVIGLAKERFTKNLWSDRDVGEPPMLVNCEDEDDQTEYVIRRILTHREAGVDLRRQAVLFRASHHSMLLEAELARRDIPFHKYGGLKFMETAHVKDLLAFLRLAENPRDVVAGGRVLPLLPGIGPGKARQLIGMLLESGGNFQVWADWSPPAAAAKIWPRMVGLVQRLVKPSEDLPGQIGLVRKFYTPLLETHYDNVQPRLRDLEQLELIASRYKNRRRMLLELTLDPPSSTQDLAGEPRLDDDYLVLSTIHSAKGLEWDAVYVIHAADGCIPSDMATKDSEEIEEERRLFYVALTRAKNWLYVCYPLRFYHSFLSKSDQHGYAQRTRFLPESILSCFQQCVTDELEGDDAESPTIQSRLTSPAIRRQMKNLW
ncbi:MAG: ATP-dependent helicase [Thermoguttaceae bacterium]|jgi:DNA helicase-2/ATP-dependent DNA helicase PcrA